MSSGLATAPAARSPTEEAWLARAVASAGGATRELTLRSLHWRGSRLALSIRDDTVAFELLAAAPAAPLIVRPAGGGSALPLRIGETVKLRRGGAHAVMLASQGQDAPAFVAR